MPYRRARRIIALTTSISAVLGAEAADFQLTPSVRSGVPGIVLIGTWGGAKPSDSPKEKDTFRPLNPLERFSFAAVGLASLAYLADKTKDMGGFRSDVALTAGSFALVGAATAIARDRHREVLDYIGVGLTSSLVSSFAEYERAFHFRDSTPPIFWSAVQASALSVYENMLRNRRIFSELGMDLGPGFFSARLGSGQSSPAFAFNYQVRPSSLGAALWYASKGYDLNVRETFRTGSLVFRADEPPGGYTGQAFGNTYAVYEPPARPTHPESARCFDVFYQWAIPAHEKTHAGQIQKGDIIAYPVNVLAEQEGSLFSWLRLGGDVAGATIVFLGADTSHDQRIQERGPTSLGNEILKRANCD